MKLGDEQIGTAGSDVGSIAGRWVVVLQVEGKVVALSINGGVGELRGTCIILASIGEAGSRRLDHVVVGCGGLFCLKVGSDLHEGHVVRIDRGLDMQIAIKVGRLHDVVFEEIVAKKSSLRVIPGCRRCVVNLDIVATARWHLESLNVNWDGCWVVRSYGEFGRFWSDRAVCVRRVYR